MSTRRARIKAVTSLPPRRKNVNNVDSKPKPAQPKEDLQKIVKSPGTPKSLTKHHEAVNTPPVLSLLGNDQNNIRTPKTAEKVSVITSAKSVFASPPPRTASPMSNIASPLVNSLKLTPNSFGFHVNKLTLQVPEIPQSVTKDLEDTDSQNSAEKMLSIDSKTDTLDDYNVPSVPESITEETVMDGIIPLQPTRTIPKPIDLLKNEIISENAEVLFDPIVPLPSPSKVRLKLRPAPRLAPLRRNSIQGSASESEDESRRALLSSGANTPAPPRQRHDSHTSTTMLQSLTNRDLNRMRTDSISSSVSQVTVTLPPVASPTKEKQYNKYRRQEMSRRMAAMRRRRETVKRDALTMYDLIFYNPTANPIVPDEDEINAKEANKRDAEQQAAVEEEVDDEVPPPADEAPVPQIKLGPNGEIILDEKSLVIKQTDNRKMSTSVVREGSWVGGGGKYTRSTRTADWSAEETVRFYRALAALGTDFTLMVPLFPDRTRRDLKIKFKKEEKVNGAQVDKALRSATTWDASRLQEEFKQERAEAATKAAAHRERILAQKKEETKRIAVAKQQHFRRSRGSKAVEVMADHTVPLTKQQEGPVTANEILQRAMDSKSERRRKQREEAQARKTAKQQHPVLTPKTPLATLTPLSGGNLLSNSSSTLEMATISRVDCPSKTPSPAPLNLNAMVGVPSNIESGSLVVLTVNDPTSPSKKMLQTYIANAGRLTPIALPQNFLNSVIGYMKKGTPRSSASASPQLMSPPPVNLINDKASTSSVIQLNPSPVKRQRHSSYTITTL